MTIYVWNGSQPGGLKDDPLNWTPNGVPGNGDDAHFINLAPDCTWNEDTAIQSILLTSNSVVILDQALDAEFIDVDGIGGGYLEQGPGGEVIFGTQCRIVNGGLSSAGTIRTNSGAFATYEVEGLVQEVIFDKPGGEVQIQTQMVVANVFQCNASLGTFKVVFVTPSHDINSLVLNGSLGGNLEFESASGPISPITINLLGLSPDATFTTFVGITIAGPTLVADANSVDGGGNTNIQFGQPIENIYEPEYAVVALLLANPDIVAIVGQQIDPNENPQSQVVPRIAYTKISDDPGRHLTGALNHSFATIELLIKGASYKETKQLARLCTNTLHGQGSQVVDVGGENFLLQSITQTTDEDEYTTPQDGSDVGIRGVSQEYQIGYKNQ